MGVKVVTPCFQWSNSQPIVPHSLGSAISSPSSKTRRCRSAVAGPVVFRHVHRLDRSALFGKLHKNLSLEFPKSRGGTLKRGCSASCDAFSDEEFSKKIQELALRFQLSDDDDDSIKSDATDSKSEILSDCKDTFNVQNQSRFPLDSVELPWEEPPWEEPQEDIIQASIERKANSMDIPLSLRIIKKKMQWQEGFREAGESAYCSVKKAFSSMVFIIRELHSYSLQMREFLFTEDLQGILVRVQKEMHASFVWLFQQVFSPTPTLMVYVMILLANFTVYSIGSNTAIAALPPTACYTSTTTTTESVSVVETQKQKNQKFDSSSVKTFSVSSANGKSTSIGGNNGGGGKVRPVSSGTDGDGWFEGSDQFRTIVPDGALHLSSLGTSRGEATESVSGQVSSEEELSIWNAILEEASKMQDESLDHETMKRFVSPIETNIEPDDYADYFKTEVLYQTALSREPNNPLLLANYAQFLYLVAHDYNRAEEYFKRAVGVEPSDAEAYSKYANFLWRVKEDLWAAEETFLAAISADPTNSHHAANYAHFLWNTGGEDTCFPLSSPDNTQEI